MIAIVSNAASERTAFVALCSSRGWECTECESLHALEKLLKHVRPGIVLTRQRLADGYSDNVIASLASAGLLPTTKVVVLIAAGSPSALEARQVTLGADLVQRDPVRTEVLAEYLAKYHRTSKRVRVAPPQTAPAQNLAQFAGAEVHLADRKLQRGTDVASLAPREIALVELLVHRAGEIVTYETLYGEILGQRFRGDTSNLRVLLGKLTSSTQRIGITLREWVEVIPKTGYRYRPPTAGTIPVSKSRRRLLSAA